MSTSDPNAAQRLYYPWFASLMQAGGQLFKAGHALRGMFKLRRAKRYQSGYHLAMSGAHTRYDRLSHRCGRP